MLKRFSIRFQLTAMIAVVTLVVLVASFSVFMWWDVGHFRQEIQEEQITMAQLVSSNGEAALAFGDSKAAAEVLGSLKVHENIEAAAFYTKEGEVLASYVKEPRFESQLPTAPNVTGSILTDEHFRTGMVITVDKERVGSLVIMANLGELNERTERFLWLIGFTVASAFALAVLMGSRLQRIISGPILELAHTMDAVTVNKDFSLRVGYRARDEIGQVASGFNNMLAEIQSRDAALQEANEVLEQRVHKRTRSLEDEIAERKAKEEQLSVSEKKLADFIESAPLGIERVDARGMILDVNQTKLEMLGYADEEYVGRSILDFHPGCERIKELIEVVVQGASGQSCEAVAHCKDGSIRQMEITASPHFENDAFVYAGLFTRDVTLLKQAEEAELAKHRAERANQAKSEFLSRMSHELRTPMNAILGFGQLLEMEPLDDRPRECVDQILKGGRHLLNLINEVLNISRIEAGTVSISLEPVELEGLMREAVDMILPLASQKGIAIETRLTECRGRYVRADRQRLSQVLINLLSNAVKYNRDGGDIQCTYEALGEGSIRIGIADSGDGIPDAVADRLFVPFDRLGAEQSEIEGTGLGLALSKTLVEAMGGRIWLDREHTGQGARFCIEFNQAAFEEPHVLQSIDGTGTIADTAAPQRTVLLIEDNLANVKLIEQLLASKSGTKLLVAMQGGLGIEFAREHRPDLILLDINLPDITGYDVAKRIKEDAALARTPIIVISADATASVRTRLQEIGIHGYLSKPLDVRLFRQLIDQLLTEEVQLIA